MTTDYLLDACAIIACLNDEIGADIVERLLEQALDGNVSLYMCHVNLLEVYYGMLRDFGFDKAEEILAQLLSLPINMISDTNMDVLREAGRLKVGYSMSLADSLALGVASVFEYNVVTADHHELDAVDNSEEIGFYWIR